MCKYILIAVLIVVVVLMALAAFVVEWFGWKGFLVYIGVLVLTLFAARRMIPWLMMRLMMRPMRMAARVLRGATITVHSVVPTSAPESVTEDDDDDYEEGPTIRSGGAIRDRRRDDADNDDDMDDDEDDEGEEDDEAPYSPADMDWYLVDFTLTPGGENSPEGRVLHRKSWDLNLVSFHQPDVKPDVEMDEMPEILSAFANFANFVPVEWEVWVNNAFVSPWNNLNEDDEMAGEAASYFGEERLRARVGVAKTARRLNVMYAHQLKLGEVQLPRIDVKPEVKE